MSCNKKYIYFILHNRNCKQSGLLENNNRYLHYLSTHIIQYSSTASPVALIKCDHTVQYRNQKIAFCQTLLLKTKWCGFVLDQSPLCANYSNIPLYLGYTVSEGRVTAKTILFLKSRGSLQLGALSFLLISSETLMTRKMNGYNGHWLES